MKRPHGCLVLALVVLAGCEPNALVPETPPKIDFAAANATAASGLANWLRISSTA